MSGTRRYIDEDECVREMCEADKLNYSRTLDAIWGRECRNAEDRKRLGRMRAKARRAIRKREGW